MVCIKSRIQSRMSISRLSVRRTVVNNPSTHLTSPRLLRALEILEAVNAGRIATPGPSGWGLGDGFMSHPR